MRLVTFLPPDGQPRAGVVVGEAVVDLAAAAPLALAESEGLQWDMLSLLRGNQDEVNLDTALEIVEAVLLAVDDDQQLSADEPGGNGQHNQGLSGNILIGGVEMLLPLTQVHLLAPLPRPASLRLFDTFRVSAFPAFTFGNHGAISGPDDEIEMPYYGGDGLYHSLEVGCIIGRQGRDLSEEEAANVIAGYTIINNWQVVDPDSERTAPGVVSAKDSDFATSLGPWLVTPDELEIYTEDDGHLSLTLATRINSIACGRANLILAHHTFAQMIAYASRDVMLYPGDVLSSGSSAQNDALPLERGDIVELDVTALGVLRNRIG